MPWISYPRVDALFDVHTNDCAESAPIEEAEWKAGAFPGYNDTPLYCSTPCRLHLSPSTELFSFDDIRDEFPRAFVENSVPYMIARAAWEQRKFGNIARVGFWGCHMTGRAAVESDRASVLYWIGLLEGMGVEIYEAPGSPLFMSDWEAGRYGVNGRRRNVDPSRMERATYQENASAN